MCSVFPSKFCLKDNKYVIFSKIEACFYGGRVGAWDGGYSHSQREKFRNPRPEAWDFERLVFLTVVSTTFLDLATALDMSPSDSPDHPGSILYNLESSEVPYSRTS
mgnify:CR=1 FL=1